MTHTRYMGTCIVERVGSEIKTSRHKTSKVTFPECVENSLNNDS